MPAPTNSTAIATGATQPGRPSEPDPPEPPEPSETFAAGPTAWVPSDPSLLGFGLVECWSCVALPCWGCRLALGPLVGADGDVVGSPGADEVGGAGPVDVDG